MSDAVSKSNIKRLEDPVYRKTFTERVSARWNDPSNNIRTIVSEAAKKQWRDPIFRKAKSENASICTRARWNDPDNELHTMLATTLENMWSDDDFRQKMSDKSRKQMLQKWKDPTFRQHITDCMKKHWTDVNGKLYRNAVMFRPSMLEYAFKLQLDNAHVKYVQQYKPDDYYKVYDFLLPDFNALVEIDGEFWHHSERAKQRGVPAKDAEKDNWAYDHGYNMVRIPECDLTPDVVDWMITELTREV
jgi:very-short-patch-repair endonuclease